MSDLSPDERTRIGEVRTKVVALIRNTKLPSYVHRELAEVNAALGALQAEPTIITMPILPDTQSRQFTILVRRGAAALLAGRIAIEHGEAATLAQLEIQANAAGPLRVWINDLATPDGQLGAFAGHAAFSPAEPQRLEAELKQLAAKPLTELVDAASAVIAAIAVVGGWPIVEQFMEAAKAQAIAAQSAAAKVGGVFVEPAATPADVRRTGDAADATGDEFDAT